MHLLSCFFFLPLFFILKIVSVSFVFRGSTKTWLFICALLADCYENKQMIVIIKGYSDLSLVFFEAETEKDHHKLTRMSVKKLNKTKVIHGLMQNFY